MIPKLLHFIWVGDELKRPDNCIDTWRALNPDWEFLSKLEIATTVAA